MIHNFLQMRLIHKKYGFYLHPSLDSGGIETNKIFFGNAQFVHLRWINKVENIHADRGIEQINEDHAIQTSLHQFG